MKAEEFNDELLEGESLTIEYKDDSHDSFKLDNILKACVGMANAAGGRVIAGVADDGEVVGSKKCLEKGVTGLEGYIRENTEPGLDTQVKHLKLADKTVTVIRVFAPSNCVTMTKSGTFYKRVITSSGEPSNIILNGTEIIKTGIEKLNLDYSARPLTSCSLDDIDLELVNQTAAEILSKSTTPADQEIFSKSPFEILQAIQLITSRGEITVAALLLFGKEDVLREKIPAHFVKLEVFDGLSIYRNDLFRAPIAKLLPYLLKLDIFSRNCDELIFEGRSIKIPEYPNDSLRELFANALTHRDYTNMQGVQIQLRECELTVASAGGFLSGITINNLLSVMPRSRNFLLANAMMRLKLVEASGRGIDKIYYFQAIYGRQEPDYSQSTPEYVKAVISTEKPHLEFYKIILKLPPLSYAETMILNAVFFSKANSVKALSENIQTNEQTTRKILNRMLENKVLTVLKKNDQEIYVLAKPSSGQPQRISGQALAQIKDRILKILEQEPGITRQQIAAVTGFSAPQIYRVLTALKKEGKVELNGKKWELIKP